MPSDCSDHLVRNRDHFLFLQTSLLPVEGPNTHYSFSAKNCALSMVYTFLSVSG